MTHVCEFIIFIYNLGVKVFLLFCTISEHNIQTTQAKCESVCNRHGIITFFTKYNIQLSMAVTRINV